MGALIQNLRVFPGGSHYLLVDNDWGVQISQFSIKNGENFILKNVIARVPQYFNLDSLFALIYINVVSCNLASNAKFTDDTFLFFY